LLKGVERTQNEVEISEKDEEPITLYLGYVPKDVSYNLSVLLDNQQIFSFRIVDYCTERQNTSVVFLLVELR
jgi:hypothetical protein